MTWWFIFTVNWVGVNHHGETPWACLRKCFQNGLTERGRLTLPVGAIIFVDWGPRLNRKEELSWNPALLSLSLSLLTQCLPYTLAAMTSSPWMIIALNCEPEEILPYLSYFYQGFCCSNEKSNQHRCLSSFLWVSYVKPWRFKLIVTSIFSAVLQLYTSPISVFLFFKLHNRMYLERKHTRFLYRWMAEDSHRAEPPPKHVCQMNGRVSAGMTDRRSKGLCPQLPSSSSHNTLKFLSSQIQVRYMQGIG